MLRRFVTERPIRERLVLKDWWKRRRREHLLRQHLLQRLLYLLRQHVLQLRLEELALLARRQVPCSVCHCDPRPNMSL